MMEVVILAGGLGTRLRHVIGEYPKCMAEVAGRPFIFYLIEQCLSQGATSIVFSLGYRHEVVEEYLETLQWTIPYTVVVEQEPLGTGGGIHLALQKTTNKNVLVLNGDSFFDISFETLIRQHIHAQSDCTLALKSMKDFERYGTVVLKENLVIEKFEEKKPCERGLINAGVYVIDVPQFFSKSWPKKFSFEVDYLSAFVSEGKFYGCEQAGYFIDIGIESDFKRAQIDLKK